MIAWCVNPRRRVAAQFIGIVTSGVTLGLTWVLWTRFDASSGQLQFVERHAWIPSLQVDYFLGIDGLGLLMVGLTSVIVPFALLASARAIEENMRSFVALMLFLQAGLYGAFTALNFVHWFLFWELTLIPAYFLIRLWGGPQRTPAANQFFI